MAGKPKILIKTIKNWDNSARNEVKNSSHEEGKKGKSSRKKCDDRKQRGKCKFKHDDHSNRYDTRSTVLNQTYDRGTETICEPSTNEDSTTMKKLFNNSSMTRDRCDAAASKLHRPESNCSTDGRRKEQTVSSTNKLDNNRTDKRSSNLHIMLNAISSNLSQRDPSSAKKQNSNASIRGKSNNGANQNGSCNVTKGSSKTMCVNNSRSQLTFDLSQSQARLSAEMETRKEKEDQVRSLQGQLEKYKTEIKEEKSQNIQLIKSVSILTADLDRIGKLKDEKDKEIDYLKSKFCASRSTCKDSIISNMKFDLVQAEAKLENELKMVEDQLMQINQLRIQVEAERMNVRKSNAVEKNLKAIIVSKDDEISELKKDLERIGNLKDQRENDIENLSKILKLKDSQLSEAIADTKHMVKLNDGKEQKIKHFNQKLRQVKVELQTKDRQMLQLMDEFNKLKEIQKKEKNDLEKIQLKALLNNSDAKNQLLERQVKEANNRVQQVKENFITANAMAMNERKKREAAERRLQRKKTEESIKKKTKSNQISTPISCPAITLENRSRAAPPVLSLNEWIGKDDQKTKDPIKSRKKNDSIMEEKDRQSELASLVHFESAFREKASNQDMSQVKEQMLEEVLGRREAEIEMIQSIYSDGEIQIESQNSSATTTIARTMLLSTVSRNDEEIEQSCIDNAEGIFVNIILTMSEKYLVHNEETIKVEASICNSTQKSSDLAVGDIDVRKMAIDSLPKLLASCRWEATINKGEESVFAVFAAADTFARDEWPNIIEKKKNMNAKIHQERGDVATAKGTDQEYSFCTMLIYSHHMYDTNKIKMIKSAASKYQLGGYVKIGTPAFIIFEGLEENCQEYYKELIKNRCKPNQKYAGKDTSTFSVCGKSYSRAKGMDGFNRLLKFPKKLEELPNDQMVEFKSICNKSGLGDYLPQQCESKN